MSLLGVISYIVAMGREEDLLLNHKPCNPILGEIHKSRIDHDDGSHTYILCEQVSISGKLPETKAIISSKILYNYCVLILFLII
jgi:hypothetical protein